MAIFKVALFIVLYLICGVGVLELCMFHDRRVEWIDRWIEEDEMLQVFVVIGFPISMLFILVWALYKVLVMFIKVTRVFFTTVIYAIVAKLKGE